MKKILLKLTLVLAVFVTTTIEPGMQAQSAKSFRTQAGIMKLSGTSTFHDWTMNGAFQVTGDFHMAEGNKKLIAINSLQFLLPVENLKSDKKKLDETAYKALKTETYKDISFVMISSLIKEVPGNNYTITAYGNLTIAGVTKPITLNVNWVQHDDQTITCSGIQKLKMTDYQVKPPCFLGVMKTGDEIALDFNFQIKS
ncbi:MAG TPA: YceI family protein [Saprospiraceae bacterium]|nr:YceI family protein [Saprospiraceae bacterium]